ncbi:transcriptional regulator, ArsR family [Pelagirhabdus alkalitolerans]|uniref:Transcriptional regulator, ArsR family n=1 Tax=Pelagirhabdus alkalitolerans TaxID=1612202 RepID=A0A1G6L167_9BACI|nr:metalloregulator ArsR/SmtB family transcription factor [Pelagirhabdus alkalitolerans]SDC36933.1 transcriptional regulator, ArsR family [Pelagirhabdus alkalitolerans]
MEKTIISIEETTALLKLLSDKTRLTMLKLLESDECCVCEFVELFQMSQPAISQHLKKLRSASVVNETRRGQWVFYSLNDQHPMYPLIQSILSEVESQDDKVQHLIESGTRVTCCVDPK